MDMLHRNCIIQWNSFLHTSKRNLIFPNFCSMIPYIYIFKHLVLARAVDSFVQWIKQCESSSCKLTWAVFGLHMGGFTIFCSGGWVGGYNPLAPGYNPLSHPLGPPPYPRHTCTGNHRGLFLQCTDYYIQQTFTQEQNFYTDFFPGFSHVWSDHVLIPKLQDDQNTKVHIIVLKRGFYYV